MKIKVWLDSGANIHSCRTTTFDTSEFGLTDEEWRELSEDEKEAMAKEVAFDRSNWGYAEV